MSGETTAVKHRCAKCGQDIEPFSADPGLWAVWVSLPGDQGQTKPYHVKCCILQPAEQLDQLRADNARLKSEVESLNDMLKTHKVIENFKSFEKCAKELQAYKTTLEKAMVELHDMRDRYHGPPIVAYEDALAAINELLQKGSK